MAARSASSFKPRDPVFAGVLLGLVLVFFAAAIFGGRVLSGADALLESEAFRTGPPGPREAGNRLLIDPFVQMQPWLRFAAAELRRGRLPLWNPLAGGGAPLLANCQSALAFPLTWLYLLAPHPRTLAWMAAAKLWLAGLFTFGLARRWGLGPAGRWFAGLTFPFCGFMVVWVQYPSTNVALFLPLTLWLADRLWERPTPRRAAALGLATGWHILGGHIETSAHLMLVLGAFVLWKAWPCRRSAPGCLQPGALEHPSGWTQAAGERARCLRRPGSFAAAMVLGIAIGGVQVVPLAEYLEHGRVWQARRQTVRSVWSLSRPAILETAALAWPYIYGSQLRGQSHLDGALGVANFNEAAGGYAGLATLAILAPLAWTARRRHPWVRFLAGLILVCTLLIYRLPVADNLVRCIPVLDVTNHRRLLLVVALGLCLLGGAGLDNLDRLRGRWARWCRGALIGAGVVMVLAAGVVRLARGRIADRALAHFAAQARARDYLAPETVAGRARRHIENARQFFPRYYLACGLHALGLAAAVGMVGRCRNLGRARAGFLVLVLADLWAFGRGYNTTVEPARYFPATPLTRFLQAQPRPFRVLALQEQFPPNTLAMYDLADLRNYDCIEVRDIGGFLEPLYAAGARPRNSLRAISWRCVAACFDRLRLADVRYLVAVTPPPPETGLRQRFRSARRFGHVWVFELPDVSPLIVARLDGPRVRPLAGATGHLLGWEPGRIGVAVHAPRAARVVVSEAGFPGWRARLDGGPSRPAGTYSGFLAAPVPAGEHRVWFEYRPASVRVGAAISAAALGLALLILIGPRGSGRRFLQASIHV